MRSQQHTQPKRGLPRLLTVLLSLSLFFTLGTGVLKQTFLNPSFVAPKVTTTQTINQFYQTVNTTVSENTESNLLPKTITEKLITSKNLKTDIQIAIERAYAGQTPLLDETKLTDQLNQNLLNIANTNGLGMAHLDTILRPIAQKASTAVVKQMNDEKVTEAVDELHQLNQTVNTLFIISGIISIILLVILAIRLKFGNRFWHYTGISLVVSGALVTLGVMGAKSSGLAETIGQQAQDFHTTVSNLITAGFNQMLIYTLITLVVGIVLWVGANLLPHR